DGLFAVSAGETVGYRLEGKAYVAGALGRTRLVFLNSSGGFVSATSAVWFSGSSWTGISATSVVPAGAVAAYIEVTTARSGTDHATLAAAEDVAVRRPPLHPLPAGTTIVPAWNGAPMEQFLEPNFLLDAGYHKMTGSAPSLPFGFLINGQPAQVL